MDGSAWHRYCFLVIEARLICTGKAMEHKDLKKLAATKMTGFAAAIADQVKNPVASLLMATDYFEQEIAKHKGGAPLNFLALEKLMGQVRSRLHSLNSYVDELSGYAQPVKISPQFIRAQDVINEVSFELSRNLMWRGTVNLIIDDAATRIFVDPKIFKQVCKSIILNSLESKTGSGLRIEIEVKKEVFSDSGVRVNFRDNGPGIEPENAEKICEPFFTTKDTSTGLGLALAKRYVEAHGGDFRVKAHSSLGGAEIMLFFPDPVKLGLVP
jgi:signal transduction histidine kinase